MGIRSRYPIALLILLLTSFEAHSAVRKHVNVPPRADVIRNSTYSFQTPYGEAAYYGREFVDRHTAGNRFSSSDRLPPGGGGGGSGSVAVKLKPTVRVTPSAVASKATGLLRVNPAMLAGSAAVGLMLDAIDGVIKDNQVMVPSVQILPPEQSGVLWRSSHGGATQWHSDPMLACHDAVAHQQPVGRLWTVEYINFATTNAQCMGNRYRNGVLEYTDIYNGGIVRNEGSCPDDSYFDPERGACVVHDLGPATDQDFSTMEGVASGFNPGYLRDLIMTSCDGSPNPTGCYDELSSQGPLDGPTSQTTPGETSSVTTTAPDGTTSTTTITTTNKFNYTFGPTYYNYSTTTTTTTVGPGGETTVEEVTDLPLSGDPPDPDDEPSREEDADPTYADTDFPEVEPFYEQKYPDGLEGIWETRKAELLDSPFISFLESFVPSFSGSCPSFSLNINIASWANYGVQNFPSLCYVFDFIKVIMLVTAVFTARALMFGG